MVNGTTPAGTALGPLFSAQEEMAAMDSFPSAIRTAIKEAPFNVSAAGMVNNGPVMAKLAELGDKAPEWLREQFLATYRQKFA